MLRRALLKAAAGALVPLPSLAAAPRTTVSIEGARFLINGRPTYQGRVWRDVPIEGLLMNARLVQGAFDDLNPVTRVRWRYPDTGRWDAGRNTREFVAAMPEWRRHGLLALTINLQGGSPEGYSKEQPWHNSAFEADGSLRGAYMSRFERILDRADALGMVVIVGYFYFGQDQRLRDDDAVRRAVRNATSWLLKKRYRHVLVEIANECDNAAYQREAIKAPQVHELITLAKSISQGGWKYPVSVSFNGGRLPNEAVVRAADYLLLHGNGVAAPERIAAMVHETRRLPGYREMPILFNEDDHFDFDRPENNFVAAVRAGASWGYFDFRMKGEGFDDGYQSVPVNWQISSARKRAFFKLLAEITGAS